MDAGEPEPWINGCSSARFAEEIIHVIQLLTKAAGLSPISPGNIPLNHPSLLVKSVFWPWHKYIYILYYRYMHSVGYISYMIWWTPPFWMAMSPSNLSIPSLETKAFLRKLAVPRVGLRVVPERCYERQWEAQYPLCRRAHFSVGGAVFYDSGTSVS